MEVNIKRKEEQARKLSYVVKKFLVQKPSWDEPSSSTVAALNLANN